MDGRPAIGFFIRSRPGLDIDRHYGARFVVRVRCEIFPNCPRYVPDFVHGLSSPYTPREGDGPPPAPDWKKWEPMRDALPKGDPHRASPSAPVSTRPRNDGVAK